MTPERHGALIRGFFSFGLVAAAAAAALWMAFPELRFSRKPRAPSETQEATPANFAALKSRRNCVVVVHGHAPGQPASDQVQGILGDLQQEKYGDEVCCAELNVAKYPELGASEGISTQNAPQLVFYVHNTRVGDYRGPWQKPDVERKIDEILNGYLQRIGKDWLPKVQGMERERGQEIIPILPAEPKTIP